MDYARRLKALADETADTLYVVMRVYFEKPRTTTGWKGLINDPHMNDSFDIEHGLQLARKVLLDVNELGLPAGTEALDPISPQYLGDLVSWNAIGARTTESQTHREMASGLSTPVGFKNGTDGGLQVAVNALLSVSRPHSFLGINPEGAVAIIRTSGNPYGHIVLRGGSKGPNYDAATIAKVEQELTKAKLPANIIVDASHANSNKDAALQPNVLQDIATQIVDGNQSIVGVMLESNLGFGNQSIPADLSQLKYGVSVTDACLDWDRTERGRPGMVMMSPQMHDDEAGAGGEADFAHRHRVAARGAEQIRVGGEAVLGLGDAHGQVAVAIGFELAEPVADLLVGDDVARVVDLFAIMRTFSHSGRSSA
jgi:3-deoxy-7-phosphoheptulonate synthase